MYSEWVSLTESLRSEDTPDTVLRKFPPQIGREVVQSILKPLTELSNATTVKNIDPNAPPTRPVSNLTTKDEVLWTMQVIGYGLTLPLTERALIAACLEVYDGWLSAVFQPKKSLPPPIVEEPGPYTQIIFKQFCYVFEPRFEMYSLVAAAHHGHANLLAQMSNHAVLCDRVLQITHHLIRHKGTKLSMESWNALLEYLLKVLDVSLSPPSDVTGLGPMLCDKLIHVLFEAWLRSCCESFPSPALWKSLRELCCCWRHHPKVVEQWNKMMYSLSLGVIRHLYSPKYLADVSATLPSEEKDFKVFLEDMPKDCLVQSWFRLLHTLGNPVDLLYPNRLTSSPAFQKVAAEFEKESRKHRHPPQSPIQGCLNMLPSIFHEAMKGVAALVYLFLAQELPEEEQMSLSARSGSVSSNAPAPGGIRHSPLLIKRKDSSRVRSKSHFYINITQLPSDSSPPPSGKSDGVPSPSNHYLDQVGGEVGKPKGNTLLHLFGGWLFTAAIWPPEETETKRRSRSFLSNVPEASAHSDSAPATSHDSKTIMEYEAGRAEAFGALCSIFSSQQCGEPFLPIYLARFYHALAVGLKYKEGVCLGQMLTKIILNSPGLLRKDLQGINVIVPSLLSALELILPHNSVQFMCEVDFVELRLSSINLLLSMIGLPLHFLNQPLPDLGGILHPETGDHPSTPQTFYSLKDKLLCLIFFAIECETDSNNIQLLLHALMVFISDIVSYENSVSQMISSPTEDIHIEPPTIDPANNQHPPLRATVSNVSTQSYVIVHSITDYSLGQLFKLSIEAGHMCLSKWAETSVALAALELMGGLAQLQIEDASHVDSRQALLWVCDYIKHQSSREHPQHNRDLHTTIVAAFSTILTWLNAHPYLMGTKECLVAVMEVIELGISGSVSAMPDGGVVYKGEKELKPVSGRVKEIAEFMLSCVMEKIGSFPSPSGAESSSSLLSEEDILAKLPQERRKDDSARFHYFVVDNSLILALLEESFSPCPPSSAAPAPDGSGVTPPASAQRLPTLTAILRSPTGRHVWSMQLRHNPRSEEPSDSHLCSVPRPDPKLHNPIPQSDVERRPWPEAVELEPGMKVDDSIPDLENVLDDSIQAVHESTAKLMAEQVEKENRAHQKLLQSLKQRTHPDPQLALEPPRIMETFNTARMFLSHLGMLGIESIKDHPLSQFPALAMLDSSSPNLVSGLCSLDRLPSRFCNTVFVLYCKEGATKPEDILAYQELSNKPPEFIEFLEGLGWIVNPVTHPGFAGKVRQVRNNDEPGRPVGISAQIPLRPFPYFADAIYEIAFVVPQLKPSGSDSAASLRSAESSDSGQGDSASLYEHQQSLHHPNAPLGETPHSSHLYPSQISLPLFQREPQGSGVCESTAQAETEKSATLPMGVGPKKHGPRATDGGDTPRRRATQPQDCAAVVVWLEKFEDHLNFPLEALSSILHSSSSASSGFGSHKVSTATKKTLPAVFIHKLSSGLYQTVTKTPSYRHDFTVGPLVDGMVISRRSLSTLVRQTTINMCSRHRMENEGLGPCHSSEQLCMDQTLDNIAKKNGRWALVKGTDGGIPTKPSLLVEPLFPFRSTRFSPPHVKRKRKIEEIVSTFRLRVPIAQFYTRLFTSSAQH